MYSLNEVIAAFIGGGIVLGGGVWLLMIIAQLRARIARLEQGRVAQPAPPPAERHWADNVPLDYRAQLASMGVLTEMVLGDVLDIQLRMDKDKARRVVEKYAPQWFNKEVG